KALAALGCIAPRLAGAGGLAVHDRAAKNHVGLAVQNEHVILPGGMLLDLAAFAAGGDVGLGVLVIQQQVLAVEPARAILERLAGLGHHHVAAVALSHRRRRQEGATNQNRRENLAHFVSPLCWLPPGGSRRVRCSRRSTGPARPLTRTTPHPHHFSPGARCALATSGLRSKPRPGLSSITK